MNICRQTLDTSEGTASKENIQKTKWYELGAIWEDSRNPPIESHNLQWQEGDKFLLCTDELQSIF